MLRSVVWESSFGTSGTIAGYATVRCKLGRTAEWNGIPPRIGGQPALTERGDGTCSSGSPFLRFKVPLHLPLPTAGARIVRDTFVITTGSTLRTFLWWIGYALPTTSTSPFPRPRRLQQTPLHRRRLVRPPRRPQSRPLPPRRRRPRPCRPRESGAGSTTKIAA